jgi:hypothetical protein
MSLDFSKYAKYRMDLFEITVTVTDLEGQESIKVETFPLKNEGIIDAMQGLMPGALIDGVMTASATMRSDDTVSFQGFDEDAKPTLCRMLRQGRDSYFQVLEYLEDPDLLRQVAEDAAREVALDRINPDLLRCKVACYRCGSSMPEVTFGLIDNLILVLPGACDQLGPSEFKTAFNANVLARFPNLFKAALRKLIPEIQEEQKALAKHLEELARYANE